MLTKKSLVVGIALILALACTGIVATSARTTMPVKKNVMAPYPKGIPAIPPGGNHDLLSLLDVTRYLHVKGFVGGSTFSGHPPLIQNLRLTNILSLDKLIHFLIPGQPGGEQVYYAQLKGPFLVLPNLPLPILSTLLPSLNNLPALLPHLGNLSGLNLFNASSLLNSLPALSSLPRPGRMPDLSHQQNAYHPTPDNGSTALARVYEVFNAHSGNLLAWG